MPKSLIAALCACLLAPCLPDMPSGLLDPMNPALSTHSAQPRLPTRGLKPFKPMETKDWLQMNQQVTPSGEQNSGMQGMPGMGRAR